MSDRERYCDRIAGRTSLDILLGVSEESVHNDAELKYLRYYKQCWREYCENKSNLIRLKGIDFDDTFLTGKLSALEESTPIQSILNREKEPNETIVMLFSNKKTDSQYEDNDITNSSSGIDGWLEENNLWVKVAIGVIALLILLILAK